MDFGLSEEQELLQETLRGFASNECPPPVVREIFDGNAGKLPALWQGLVEMGIGGLAIPEAQGGAGLEILDLALVAEVLGEAALPGPFLGHALAGLALAFGGSEAQQEKWLPRLASGEAVGSVALGGEKESWDPSGWTARVEGGRIRGRFGLVPGAATADVLVVGTAGGGLALVERASGGVRIEPFEGVDRTRPLARVVLEGVACEPLAGDARASTRVRDVGLVLLAADAFGAASALVNMSVAYAGSREQFGQPIGGFQAVKHQLANMALEVEPTRALWWYAAHAFDHLPDEAPRAAALAKSHITDRAMQVARDSVELHGGIGFTWECDVQIWYKRAMFDRMWLGAPELHRERVAALGGW